MMEIARLENISVSDEEVDEEIEREAALRKVPAPMLRKEMGKENRRQELLSSILEKKIFDFVKSVVTITEVDASATPEDAPEPDGEKPVEAEASGSDDAPKAKKRAAAKTEKKKATAKKSAADKGAAKKKASRKKASKKTADKAEAKKTTAKKTTAKKTAAKKTAAKKTTAKKTAAKKSTAKKSAAKTTAKKKK
jgi:hypothetical protein